MGIRSKASGPDFVVARNTGFVQRGFGIKVIRRSKRIRAPELASIDIVSFIKKKFPLAGTFGKHCGCKRCKVSHNRLPIDKCVCRWCRQARLAARWAVVIQRYIRMEQSDISIDQDSGWKLGTCASIAQKIRRRLSGQREDGVQRTGRKRGRPKTAAIDVTEYAMVANSC